MTVDDLRDFYGANSDASLAKILKRPRSTIHYWREGGISPRTQATFEVISQGKLKADRHALKA